MLKGDYRASRVRSGLDAYFEEEDQLLNLFDKALLLFEFSANVEGIFSQVESKDIVPLCMLDNNMPTARYKD